MSETTDARPDAVGAPVERPVRPSLAEAIDALWEVAFAEGQEGRYHDTEDGAAQTALQDIWAAHSAALAAAVAAERERCARHLGDLRRRLTGTTAKALASDCALRVASGA